MEGHSLTDCDDSEPNLAMYKGAFMSFDDLPWEDSVSTHQSEASCLPEEESDLENSRRDDEPRSDCGQRNEEQITKSDRLRELGAQQRH